jgi:LacI family transcriptional regulator
MALGAARALREHGMKIPDDVALTGFDNIEKAAWEGLTTVAIPNYERGYLAARALLENINGKGSNETKQIAARVIWRNTTKSKI